MKYLKIRRFANAPMGTFGEMSVNGMTLNTVERPWLDNQRNISCIPAGKYICKPRWYYRGNYKALEVINVPNRTHILFHKGNTMHDVQGCIAVTSYLGCLHGMWAGLNSRNAWKAFIKEYGDGPVWLDIVYDIPKL